VTEGKQLNKPYKLAYPDPTKKARYKAKPYIDGWQESKKEGKRSNTSLKTFGVMSSLYAIYP